MDGRGNQPQQQNNSRPQPNINLKPKDILEKEFKTKMRGYDPAEVDEFLDDVIKDYETFTNQVEQLSQENARLIARIDELSKQAANGGGNAVTGQNGGASNYDILKRLSNLERRVFGQSRNGSETSATLQGQPAGMAFNNNPTSTSSTIANPTTGNRAGRYQNNPAAPNTTRSNNFQAPNQAPARPNSMPQPVGPNASINSNPAPRQNPNMPGPRNNQNFNTNYSNNRFDQNDPDPRFQNSNTPNQPVQPNPNQQNRYNNNNDLNRF